jgi:hypothetical protein
MTAVDELRPEIIAAAGDAVQLLVEGPSDPSRSSPSGDSAFSPRSSASAAPSPTTSSPPLPPAKMSAAKKANPLVDLIDTEKNYVELLTGIIRVRSPARLWLLLLSALTPSSYRKWPRHGHAPTSRPRRWMPCFGPLRPCTRPTDSSSRCAFFARWDYLHFTICSEIERYWPESDVTKSAWRSTHALGACNRQHQCLHR